MRVNKLSKSYSKITGKKKSETNWAPWKNIRIMVQHQKQKAWWLANKKHFKPYINVIQSLHLTGKKRISTFDSCNNSNRVIPM